MKSNKVALDLVLEEIRLETGSSYELEYRFHPKRKWRFDVAFPAEKVAVEIEGGVWQYGRHNRAAGFLADLEKYNAAALRGWCVLRYTWEQVGEKKTKAEVERALRDRWYEIRCRWKK